MLALHEATGLAVFLGVQAGDHLIYIAEAGIDPVEGFAARTNIRRTLLMTAAGKALLAEQADAVRLSYLRRRAPDEREMVDHFLGEIEEIRKSKIATNQINKRFAIAACVRNLAGSAVAAVTLVGPEQKVKAPNGVVEQNAIEDRGHLVEAFWRSLGF